MRPVAAILLGQSDGRHLFLQGQDSGRCLPLLCLYRTQYFAADWNCDGAYCFGDLHFLPLNRFFRERMRSRTDDTIGGQAPVDWAAAARNSAVAAAAGIIACELDRLQWCHQRYPFGHRPSRLPRLSA